ncbi:carbohydrate porin [Psychromonas algicola]|uniref:carbohydrate porin n=1 Tax=Psychromonas algicola TaxID=2555642 RepID=UPI00106781F2|nr:carbohydrate porin [Psychromonas sp. RZ5]TEW52282.1 carbohydrate porin [Psychromonas sp. RZ5]
MKMNLKLLPLSIAAALSAFPVTSMAEESDTFIFSGYARYGMAYADGDSTTVAADDQKAGNAAGRLGNEGNGGEFQFTKKFVNAEGAKWDVAVMLEHWGDNVGLKKFYAGGSNIFESQPNAYVWAGRDFHQRPQQGLNDYFYMSHDGQGAGVKNIELGDSTKLDFAVVGQAASGTGDNGDYAFTSKLHGLNLSDSLALSFLFNVGFSSDDPAAAVDAVAASDATVTDDGSGGYIFTDAVEASDATYAESDNSYQLAAVFDQSWSMGGNKFIVRYADGADNSVFTREDDLTTLYFSMEGNVKFNETMALEYLGAYHNYAKGQDDSLDTTNYSVISRGLYTWNSVHSTWLEAGYSIVDFDNQDATNTAWKVTLSQNIAIDAFANARPMLRFYATVGDAEVEVEDTTTAQDTFTLGAMFESWW